MLLSIASVLDVKVFAYWSGDNLRWNLDSLGEFFGDVIGYPPFPLAVSNVLDQLFRDSDLPVYSLLVAHNIAQACLRDVSNCTK